MYQGKLTKLLQIFYEKRHQFDTLIHLAEDSTAGQLTSEEKVKIFDFIFFQILLGELKSYFDVDYDYPEDFLYNQPE